jgi:uncharacterized protein YkwD
MSRRCRRLFAALALTLAALAALAAPAGAGPGDSAQGGRPAPDVFLGELAQEINQRRLRAGLPALAPDRALARAADVIVGEAGRGRRSLPELGPVDLTGPLLSSGVRDRLVHGIQSRFGVGARDLVDGLMANDWERGQILAPEYSSMGAAVKSYAEGPSHLTILFSTGVVDVDLYRREIFRLVNRERQSRGLAPVAWSPSAARAAQIRAMELDRLNGHTRPSGQNWSTILEELGLRASEAGENLAMGLKSAEEFIGALMASPGHREVILTPSFDQLGVGCQVGADGQMGCVQLFLRQ